MLEDVFGSIRHREDESACQALERFLSGRFEKETSRSMHTYLS